MTTFNQIATEYQFKTQDDRKKALDSLQSKVQKRFGKESITTLNGKVNLEIPHIPSQILSLDLALGVGGIPKGRIIEFFGDSSAGKTTLSLNFIRQVQQKGGIAAFVDAEHALDSKWAKARGVNIDELLISQPGCGEEALEITEELIESGQVAIVVVDSVAALIPRAELEKDMGESSMGLQARLMSQACRKLTAMVSKTGTILIFLNQVRDTIGGYGPTKTTTGGNALKFYASQRLELARKETLKKGEDVYGVKTRVKVVKNKVASPFTECTFDLIFKEGYDFEGSVVEEAVKYDLIQKGGAWFTYKGEKFQGLNGIKSHLKSNPGVIDSLRQDVLVKVKALGLSDKEVNLEDDVKRRTLLKEEIEAISEQPIIEEKAEEVNGTEFN